MQKPNDPNVATVPERIKGGISALLCITCMTVSCNNTDAQWQVCFLIAGVLYMMTTFAYVFDKFDGN